LAFSEMKGKKIGIEFKRITLPPKLTNQLHHSLRRDIRVSNKRCQVDSHLELAPIGRRKYLKGA